MVETEFRTETEGFLSKQKILIADTNRASRVGIARALADMGAMTAQMVLVDSYAWAEETIRRAKPGVIVLDYQMESRCGLDLLQSDVPADSRLTIMVTNHNSQSAVAYAAEGDVDVFISKPYNLDTFRQSISAAIEAKLNPSEYVKTINDGRRYLATSDLTRAMEFFEKATLLDQQPALAYFYHGRVQQLNRALAQAQISYLKGLKHNDVHYKCLLGLYESLMEQKKLEDAYTILRRIVQKFPLNPRRFAPLIRLAIQNRRFEDMEEYYDSFLAIESKSDEIVKHACAGLIVAGKYYLGLRQPEKALQHFHKAAVSASGRVALLREIVLALADGGMAHELDPFLTRFPQEERAKVDFKALDYLSLANHSPLHVTLERGRKLIKEGFKDPMIFRILIEATAKAGFIDQAENLVHDAVGLWPDKKPIFITLLPR